MEESDEGQKEEDDKDDSNYETFTSLGKQEGERRTRKFREGGREERRKGEREVGMDGKEEGRENVREEQRQGGR